jgi:hypothetical protein
VEEGAEIQIKCMENLFSEIIAENITFVCNTIDTHAQEAFQTPNRPS